MPARVLMVQGSSSSVGKSLLCAALCRIFARRGVRVAPFKAQNMSNNAAVCSDGAEIGRAQALQAAAAGVEPVADMNPILLKPEGNARAQVIVRGRPWRTLSARDFYRYKGELWSSITVALDRLRCQYEVIVVEGAGSPVELNLRESDIVNMAVARYAGAAVLLVGDIDRGGVFAQLLGTLDLLPAEERALVRGLVINKFRGDPDLFGGGVRILEERGGVPVLGIVPYLEGMSLPEEDAVALAAPGGDPDYLIPRSAAKQDIVIIRLPHIANFDDFDLLQAEAGVRLRYVNSVASLGHPDAILLPGTKSTMADLGWLQKSGLADAITRLAKAGLALAGICGGYQMLGERISDPDGLESHCAELPGLSLLPIATAFVAGKSTYQARARIRGGPSWLKGLAGTNLTGYEIHMGTTRGRDPWLEIVERNGRPVEIPDGSVSGDGRIWGCYLHGLFANHDFRRSWLQSLGRGVAAEYTTGSLPTLGERLDSLADAAAAAIDMKRLGELCLLPQASAIGSAT